MPEPTAHFVPVSDWRWFGCAGHFVGWRNCYFRLHTRVGDWRISSVGDYHPPMGRSGPHSAEPETIGAGADALYETYVFRLVPDSEGENGEGEVADWSEVEGIRSATEAEAQLAHMEACRKYAFLADFPPVKDP